MTRPNATRLATSPLFTDFEPDAPRKVARCPEHGDYSPAVAECPKCASRRIEARRDAVARRINPHATDAEREQLAAMGRESARKRNAEKTRAAREALARKRAEAVATGPVTTPRVQGR